MNNPVINPPNPSLDFDELDRLHERSEAALAWLEAREPDCTQFKQAADARSVRAVYYNYLKRVAPELVRLARIGAQAEHDPDKEASE